MNDIIVLLIRTDKHLSFFYCVLIAILTHILFVTFFSLFMLHLQLDIVSPLLLNADD